MHNPGIGYWGYKNIENHLGKHILSSQLKYLRKNLDGNGNPLVDNFRPTQDNGNVLYHYKY